MGQPAARLGDMHVCQMITALTPHVGGLVIGPGCPTVLVGGLPAACVGDMVACTGPPDTIVMGSATILLGGRPAAQLGSLTAHGGTLVAGYPSVHLG